MKIQVNKLKHLRFPITPYQLFSPVSTVFEDNLTYEEQLLGLYKLYNEFITKYNLIIEALKEVQELVDTFPEQFEELRGAITALQTSLLNHIEQTISNINQIYLKIADVQKKLEDQIATGLLTTLDQANKYTDSKFNQLDPSNWGSFQTAITAEVYDGLGLTAEYYDSRNITAYEYDTNARIIFLGDLTTAYVQFQDQIAISANETVFDLSGPPAIIPGRRYRIEISLGSFALNSNENAHLEIVGKNTLGNSLPISVPSGGSATVCGVFTEIPTVVRAMSDQTDITAYNAYIRIKPLGEA